MTSSPCSPPYTGPTPGYGPTRHRLHRRRAQPRAFTFRCMRRAIAVGGGFGLANAVVAAVLLSLVPRGSHPTGWFAYAPLADYKVLQPDVSQPDWAIIAVPIALVVLNVVLVMVAIRRRWLLP